jgi:hypothetical protein
MQIMKLSLSSIPIWVKLMHLPLEYWTSTCLGHAASGIGKPLYVDRNTEEQKRLGYARVLVEIDTSSECPKEILISRAHGSTLSIGVEYPWLPPKYTGCGGFGHATYARAATKEKQIWVPKKTISAAVKEPQKIQTPKKFDKTIRRPMASRHSVEKPVEKIVPLRRSLSPLSKRKR